LATSKSNGHVLQAACPTSSQPLLMEQFMRHGRHATLLVQRLTPDLAHMCHYRQIGTATKQAASREARDIEYSGPAGSRQIARLAWPALQVR